jgi:hypothetical protein
MKKFFYLSLIIGSTILYSCGQTTGATNTPPPAADKQEEKSAPITPTLPEEVVAKVTSVAISDIKVIDVTGECSGKGNKEVSYSISFKTSHDAEATNKIPVRIWDCGDTENSKEAIANYAKLLAVNAGELEAVLQRRDNTYAAITLRTAEKIIPGKEGKIAKLEPAVDLWKE